MNKNTLHNVFPFAAIIGQEKMKLSLMLNAINPAIGGVLIRGEKGTAKSTAVRGISRLMPPLQVIDNCSCHCDPHSDSRCAFCQARINNNSKFTVNTISTPIVDLPLGATEDMVIGSIDFEAAVKTGISSFIPGMLARANRGILYIDEVNLLDDHLVDAILDVSESGLNIVEREGMSVSHPSRFMLIGTMNPEEGELRPQILDRFGLAVQVEAESDVFLRVELLRRREQFDIDPESLSAVFDSDSAKISETILSGRQLLNKVFIPNHLRTFIAEICTQNSVAGHRADLVIERAARAHAALNGRCEVSSDDIISVSPLALLHRIRNAEEPQIPPPPPPPQSDENEPDQSEEKSDDSNDQQIEPEQSSNEKEQNSGQNKNSSADSNSDGEKQQPRDQDENSSLQNDIFETGEPFKVQKIESDKDKILRSGSGRRSHTRSATKQGRYVKSTPLRGRNDLALDATIRAAAPFQKIRKSKLSDRNLAIYIEESDVREKIRERRVGNVLLFLVDGSGSMGAQRRMVETKAAIMSLLLDAYQKRDKVCMIVFRGDTAEVLLPPTGSVDLAGRLLCQLPIGGRTPLSAGLSKTTEMLNQILRKTPSSRPLVLIVTDGKANKGFGNTSPHQEALLLAGAMREQFETTRFAVIDTEPPGIVRFELARSLATTLNAKYFHPESLRAEDLVRIAKDY